MAGYDFRGTFLDRMPGGAFICRAHGNNEILFVNEKLIEFYECDDLDEFMEFTGGRFAGIANETRIGVIKKDVLMQIEEAGSNSGYVFFNIRTKKDNRRRVVSHWELVRDEINGDLVYGIVFSHKLENSGTDFDTITGLFGKRKFRRQIANAAGKSTDKASRDFAIVYINLVNFKLLNIERGVAEGDSCLKVMAETLTEAFEDAVIARLSDDHFVIFTEYDEVRSKTEEAERRFCETYGNHYNVIGKFGICRIALDADLDVENALSQAKVACDFIKYDPKADIVEYSEDLAKSIKTQEYVIRRIDEAIEKEWIKVYYQPVIRSLTGNLSSMESLVRWDDPKLGFLSPDKFIPTLEKERCIHKLDSYVVEKVCQCMHDRVKAKLPTVPVSVNFSRIDFLMCDMLGVVERAVEKYDIPRDYIHIEITESMIASDEELMGRVIGDFRKAGYEIWMDDFGSGYSSLTVLKDYRFDTLKLDMRFQSPFTDKSKSIMCSTITMAKDLGMKTLAEGVETKEQLDFLREIGCDLIQGYYYGKPEPVEQVFSHLNEKKIDIESRKWRHFYEVASFNVRATDEPLEIVEDDGKNFRNLYMNRSYRNQIFDEEIDFDDINRRLYHTGSPLLVKFREFADQVEKSGVPETFYYTAGGSFLRLNAQLLEKKNGHFLIKCSLYNLSHDSNIAERERIDTRLRDINLLFESVLMVNLKENTVKPLLGEFRYITPGKDTANDLQESIRIMAEKMVFPTERQRCLDFMRSADLYKRVEKTGKGYIEGIFRLKQEDGNYSWKEIYIMLLPGSDGNEYLYCMKSYVDKPTASEFGIPSAAESDVSARYLNIWRNLLWVSNIRLYWKDKDRRFLGASQAFLDFFELASLKDIIGKTDEDMSWRVTDEPNTDPELEVLKKGSHLIDVPGKCIAKGTVYRVIRTMAPLYEGDEIVGIIGYFEDIEEKLSHIQGIELSSKTDRVTGLMNAHASIDTMIDYVRRYRDYGEEYGLIVLNNTRHERIITTYGEEFAEKVLKVIGERIVSITGDSCAVARQRDSVFAIITNIKAKDEIHVLGDRILNELNGINEVEGNSVTLRIKLAAKARSEADTSDEGIYEWCLKEVTKE